MLTADLMVGFPTEDDEDFQATLDFVSRVGLLSAHVFAYSKREGTPAASYEGQVPDIVKRERSAALIKEVGRVRDDILSEVVASALPMPVIFEQRVKDGYIGHSDSYIEVVADSDDELAGRLCTVKPKSHKNGIIYGEIVEFDN
jgi:threonylcarbamoyladenosine tRNA methylthiotransferase MtaB